MLLSILDAKTSIFESWDASFNWIAAISVLVEFYKSSNLSEVEEILSDNNYRLLAVFT